MSFSKTNIYSDFIQSLPKNLESMNEDDSPKAKVIDKNTDCRNSQPKQISMNMKQQENLIKYSLTPSISKRPRKGSSFLSNDLLRSFLKKLTINSEENGLVNKNLKSQNPNFPKDLSKSMFLIEYPAKSIHSRKASFIYFPDQIQEYEKEFNVLHSEKVSECSSIEHLKFKSFCSQNTYYRENYAFIQGYISINKKGLTDNTVAISKIYEDKYSNKSIIYFGMFCGEDGDSTAKFLKENLHKRLFTVKNNFNPNIFQLITQFESLDFNIIQDNDLQNNYSSATAIVGYFRSNMAVIANTGDSSALLSRGFGEKCYRLNILHNFMNLQEQERLQTLIHKHTYIKEIVKKLKTLFNKSNSSRFFGAIDKKQISKGGIKDLYLSTPDVIQFKIKEDFDYILFVSPKITASLSKKQIHLTVYATIIKSIINNFHMDKCITLCLENIVEKAGQKDNLSGVLVFFREMADSYMKKDITQFEKKKKKKKKKN